MKSLLLIVSLWACIAAEPRCLVDRVGVDRDIVATHSFCREMPRFACIGRGESPMSAAVSQFASAFDSARRNNELVDGVRRLGSSPETVDVAATIARIRAFQAEAGIDGDKLAAAVQVEPLVLQKIMTDAASIPPAALNSALVKIAAWLDRETARREVLQAGAIIETPVTMASASACRIVREVGCVGLLTGPSGCGKSAAVRSFVSRAAGAVYLRVDTDARGARGMLGAFADALGLHYRGVAIRTATIVSAMRGGVRIVAIDEAQLLAGSRPALEAIRAIGDSCGVGLLLIGTASLGGPLGDRSTDDGYGPLVGRIGVRVDLSREVLHDRTGKPRAWLARELSDRILANAVAGEFSAEAKSLFNTVAMSAPGMIRRAVHVAKLAAMMGRGGMIDVDVFRGAAAMAAGE